ncbi:MAG: oligosaccharide flippase family protein [Phycisphaerae bacterium]
MTFKRQTIINLISNYANTTFVIVTSIVMVPLYLKYFNMDVYGAWMASGNIVGMLGLLDGGINLVMTQRLSVAHANNDPREFSKYFTSGVIVSLAFTVLIPIICLYYSGSVPRMINYHVDYQRDEIILAFSLASIGAFMSFNYSTLSTAYQALGNVTETAIVSLSIAIIGVVSTILSLRFGWGITSLAIGQLVRPSLGVFCLIILMIPIWRRKVGTVLIFDLKKIVYMLKTSMFIMATRLVGQLAGNAESLILSNMIDTRTAGIWAVSSRSISVIGGLMAPIGSSMFAPIAKKFTTQQLHESWKLISKYIVAISTISIILLSTAVAMNGTFVGLWVGYQNYAGVECDILNAFAVYFVARISFSGLIIAAKGNNKTSSFCSSVGSIAQLGTVFMLVSQLGIIGLPLSKIIGSAIITLPLIAYYQAKIFRVEYYVSAKINYAGLLMLVVTTAIASIVSILTLYYLANWFAWVSVSVLAFSIICFYMYNMNDSLRIVYENNFKPRLISVFTSAR